MLPSPLWCVSRHGTRLAWLPYLCFPIPLCILRFLFSTYCVFLHCADVWSELERILILCYPFFSDLICLILIIISFPFLPLCISFSFFFFSSFLRHNIYFLCFCSFFFFSHPIYYHPFSSLLHFHFLLCHKPSSHVHLFFPFLPHLFSSLLYFHFPFISTFFFFLYHISSLHAFLSTPHFITSLLFSSTLFSFYFHTLALLHPSSSFFIYLLLSPSPVTLLLS